MRAAEDSNDAAFGALRSGDAAPALDSCEDVVAVHGIFDGGARNEDVAVKMRHRDVGNDETITVLVENEAPFYFVAIRQGGTFLRRRRPPKRLRAGRLLLLPGGQDAGASPGHLLAGAAPLWR